MVNIDMWHYENKRRKGWMGGNWTLSVLRPKWKLCWARFPNFLLLLVCGLFSIYWYAAVSLDDQFVIFGGTHDGTNPLNGIFAYKNDVWTKLGTLNQARYQHSAISNENEIMIVGGLTSNTSEVLFSSLSTEVWNIAFDHNRIIKPELSGFHFYPELFLVPYNFSSNL